MRLSPAEDRMTTPPDNSSRASGLRIGLAAVILAIVAAGAFGLWYLFLRPSGPAPVGNTPVVVPTAGASSATAASSAGSSAAPLSGGLDGTWNVDTSIGSFSDFTNSFVGYRVQEELANVGGNIAVGRTPTVSGSLTIAGSQVTAVTIEADLTALKSDENRRDGQLSRQGIETSTFPTATFKLTSPIDLGSVPADGVEVSVTGSGQLTLHGQTKDVQIPLKAKLSGSTIVVTGSLDIAFADYGISKPTSFAVLSIADTGTIEMQLFFTKA
jgi:polyisoprenoid-binding protein YceI